MKKMLVFMFLIPSMHFAMERPTKQNKPAIGDGLNWHETPNHGMVKFSSFIVGQKKSGDSLDDCRELSRSFYKKMYEGTKLTVDKDVDDTYAKLDIEFKKKGSLQHVLFAIDRNIQKLVACVALKKVAKQSFCIMHVMGIDPKYCETDVLSQVIGYIPTLVGKEIEQVFTPIRRIKPIQELVTQAGFYAVDFNPPGCPVKEWQGYKLEFKKDR